MFVLPLVSVTLLVGHQRLLGVGAQRAEVDGLVCLVDVMQGGHLFLRLKPLLVGHRLDVATCGETLGVLDGMLDFMQQRFRDAHRVEVFGVEDMEFVDADGDLPCLGVVCRSFGPFPVRDDWHGRHVGICIQEWGLRQEFAQRHWPAVGMAVTQQREGVFRHLHVGKLVSPFRVGTLFPSRRHLDGEGVFPRFCHLLRRGEGEEDVEGAGGVVQLRSTDLTDELEAGVWRQ